MEKNRRILRYMAVSMGNKSINIETVGARFNWECQRCGRVTPRELKGTSNFAAPTIDHIIPITKGGEHEWDNIQLLCRTCNRKKGNKLPIS